MNELALYDGHVPIGMVRQADSDTEVVQLWLHGRSPHTQRAYRHDVSRFQTFVRRPLASVGLRDIQAFADSLTGLSDGSVARKLAAVKSLLTFSQKIGYLQFNVGAAVEIPKSKDCLAERILSEELVIRMLSLEVHPRNHALLRLLYVGGLRVSEICGLKWRDLQPHEETGQVTVFGKGRKTRVVRLTLAVWVAVTSLRQDAGPDSAVFRSQKAGGHLDPSQALRIVRKAAIRAGIDLKVSPHWMRHAHASHALDRGAPIHLVQATLGHSSVATTGRYLHARPHESSARFLAV